MKYLFGVLLYLSVAIGSAHADMVAYNVSINTSFLAGLGTPFTFPPYYLDFQFFAGDASEPTPNTVTVTSTGGQFTSFTLTAGPIPGSGEDLVPFNLADPTTFTVSFTENVEPGLITPDLLSIFICDVNFNYLATEDPTLANSFLDFKESIDPGNPGIVEVDTYDTPTQDLNVSALLVSAPDVSAPEPRTWLTSSIGVFAALFFARRRVRMSRTN